jgi:hypothetical protein
VSRADLRLEGTDRLLLAVGSTDGLRLVPWLEPDIVTMTLTPLEAIDPETLPGLQLTRIRPRQEAVLLRVVVTP